MRRIAIKVGAADKHPAIIDKQAFRMVQWQTLCWKSMLIDGLVQRRFIVEIQHL